MASPAESRIPLALEIVRYFDAAPERVFDAWLSEHWAQWLAWVGAHSPEETVLTVSFAGDGAGTRLTLQHVGFGSAELRDRHHLGWSSPTGALRHLENLLK